MFICGAFNMKALQAAQNRRANNVLKKLSGQRNNEVEEIEEQVNVGVRRIFTNDRT